MKTTVESAADIVSGAAGEPTPTPSVDVDHAKPRKIDGLWLPLTAIVTFALAVLPLAFNRRFYFLADTALGAYGQWFYLGQKLREGVWPGMELSRWGSGNFLADGQWGLFSALTMSISLAATMFNNILVFVSAVKIGFLVLGAVGLYLLARSFKVSPAMAAVLGVSAALGGFTIHIDAASWVTNLEIWALVPWTWWGIRRIVAGHSPWIALLFGYFTVTTGYVHGTLVLVVVFAGVLAMCLIERQFRAAWRVLFTGIAVGLMAVVVFLPGVLSSAVTVRDNTGVRNTEQMTATLSDMLGSISPTAQMGVEWWWGTVSLSPIMYIAWFLPLVVLIDFGAAKAAYRELVVPFVMLFVMFLFVTGPSEVGPLRFPTRLMPFFGTALLLIVVVLLDRYRVQRLTRARVWSGIILLGVCSLQILGSTPDTWKVQAQSLVGIALGLALALFIVHIFGRRAMQVTVSTLLASLIVVGCIAATVQQRIHFDAFESNPTPELPTQVSDYKAMLPEAKNNGVVVGDTSSATYGKDMYTMAAASNLWYLNDNVAMLNTYYVAAYRNFADLICEQNQGQTCGDLLGRLVSNDRELKVPLADLMSLDSILIVKADVSREQYDKPMAGWSVAAQNERVILWVRDVPRGPAGGVVWASSGVKYANATVTDVQTTVKVDSVPQGGGDLVLSRLPWPGYSVAGEATLAAPHAGYLVKVHVPESAAGTVVTVNWDPPMWNVMKYAGLGAAALSLLLIVWAGLMSARRRRKQRDAQHEPIATSPLASAVAAAEATGETRETTFTGAISLDRFETNEYEPLTAAVLDETSDGDAKPLVEKPSEAKS